MYQPKFEKFLAVFALHFFCNVAKLFVVSLLEGQEILRIRKPEWPQTRKRSSRTTPDYTIMGLAEN